MKYFKFTNKTGLLPKEDPSFKEGMIYPGDKKVGRDDVQYFSRIEDTSVDWEEVSEEEFHLQQNEIFDEAMNSNSNPKLIREDFPMYKCHKEVGALEIKAINNRPAPLGTWCDATLSFEGEYNDIVVESHWMIKNKPKVGGYFIVYEDGYTSYSPKEVFEAGYTKISQS